MCFAPQQRALFRHLKLPRVVCTWSVLYVLIFFDISSSKSGPYMRCFVHFDLEMCFAPQRRALFWHLNSQKWSEHVMFDTVWLGNVLRARTACTFSTSQLPKVVHFDLKTCFAPQRCALFRHRIRTCDVLYILTWKCASRHNGVHFFDISTSKSGPGMMCFVQFDLKMCFAPQRCALFRHRNFQKCSVLGVFCTFWLGNMLRATTACNFSSLFWRHGSAPAAWASLLFDHPEPQIIGKHNESRLAYLLAHLHFLSSHSFSSLLFSLLGFSSLTLPTSAFPSVLIVGSLTSKLRSITILFHRNPSFPS